ncbi:MAG TPA: bifunctional glutamate N-acetyltransferase/amino-acid acetyltransferase ArgJ [Planctomycetota bacterium]|nr:bifunctional glutamate N-acetyltransferase/amino-acid acetyltransferase ArgJ [Planctomycetota bacterium]
MKRASKSAAKPIEIQPWNGLIHEVPGFRTASLHCGLKTAKEQPPDLALVFCEQPAVAAGVFTLNRVCAAPVTLCRAHLKKSKQQARALIINAGNANACTGEQGAADARKMAELTAAGLKCKPEEVLVFSTGIIGRKLPMDKVEAGIARAVGFVKEQKNTGDFARGIMTTDLVPKTAAVYFELDGKVIHVAGACKGSGMIAPNMATMLGVVVTDAAVSPALLQELTPEIADETFNCVTVDGDTSTNDSIAVFASGAAGNKTIAKTTDPAGAALRNAIYAVCDSLARQIAADGEGAKHTITLYVGGTKSDEDAKKIARTIAESPLVKTAIAGNDPNWGRIMAAAGRAGVVFDPLDAVLTVNGHELFRAGQPLDFDKATVSNALKSRDTSIVLLVGDGPGRAKFYTCDFTHEYITINADYHT